MEILSDNRHCDYGKQYNFQTLNSVEKYQSQVPVVQYDNLKNLIERQTQGQNSVCSDTVLFYEETSGSSSGRKLLPYTQKSLLALQHAVNPWLYDLITHQPSVTNGPSYWSISPAGRAAETTADGTTIGAPSDLAFLTESMQGAFVELLAAPPQVASITDIEEWRYHTLFALIANDGLTLISVWNPSFITLLIDAIPENTSRLIQDLTSPDNDISLDSAFWQATKPVCDKQDMLARVTSATQGNKIDTTRLWPALDTISCWTHGAASQSLPLLKQYFPTQYIQPKGLLATEAVVSIPLSASDYPVLAAKSAFFEFRDNQDNIHLAHELEADTSYEVIVTTFGGLYRYAMGDTVKVRGHHKQLPTLEFTGRSGITSDLRGEKLDDAFVANCLQEVPGFSIIAADSSSINKVGYTLYVDADMITDTNAPTHCQQTEDALLASPQYQYARHLGQLQPLKLVRVSRPQASYTEYCNQRGQLLGDIKPIALCIHQDLIDTLMQSAVGPVYRATA